MTPTDGQQLSLEDQIHAEVQRALAQNANPNANTQLQPQSAPIRLNVNGQERVYSDPAQLQTDFQRAQEERDAALRQAQEATQRLQQQPQQVAQPQADDYNHEHYLELLAQDGRKAMNYADRYRYGVENVPDLMKAAMIKTAQNDRLLTAFQFRDINDEYYVCEDNGKTMEKIIEMHRLPWTVEGLSAAYAIGKQNKWLKDAPQEQGTAQQAYDEPQQNYAPGVGRGSYAGAENPSFMDDFSKLNTDQMAEILRKYPVR